MLITLIGWVVGIAIGWIMRRVYEERRYRRIITAYMRRHAEDPLARMKREARQRNYGHKP